jgi:transcriptional regulator with XRE-family HTH domain
MLGGTSPPWASCNHVTRYGNTVLLMLRLRALREEQGLSLRKLAELSGVHYMNLFKIENGHIDPQLSTLLKVCKALGVTLDGLVGQPIHKGGRKRGRQNS